MHPPFFTVDHKIGPDIYHQSESKPVVRRNKSERLGMSPAAPGWPPVPVINALHDPRGPLQAPSGHVVTPHAILCVVPPPQRTLRDMIGRFLIRAGQRMIMENRA